MRRNATILFFLIIVGMLPYLYVTAYFQLAGNEFGIVQERASGRIERTFYAKRNFIWQGACPWWFSVYTEPGERVAHLKPGFAIPELATIPGDRYLVWFPVRIKYRIDPARFRQLASLASGSAALQSLVERELHGVLDLEITPYLSPLYRYQQLVFDATKVLARASEKLKGELQGRGIEPVELALDGTITMPNYLQYRQGLAYCDELFDLEKKSEKELKNITAELQRQKLVHKDYYEHLGVISDFIKKNPDILKYLYIDKLGEQLKAVPPSELGIPAFLERKTPEIAPKKGGDIDNLR